MMRGKTGGLTDADLLRCLRRYRYDPAINPGMHKSLIPLKGLAALCGEDAQKREHTAVEFIIEGKQKIDDRTRPAIAKAVGDIESGRVRFRHRGWAKKFGGTNLGYEVEYREPPKHRPLPQDKLVPAADWREWAPCRNCGGDRFDSIAMNGGFYYACRQCCGREHWPALGARPTTVAERNELPEAAMNEDFGFVKAESG